MKKFLSIILTLQLFFTICCFSGNAETINLSNSQLAYNDKRVIDIDNALSSNSISDKKLKKLLTKGYILINKDDNNEKNKKPLSDTLHLPFVVFDTKPSDKNQLKNLATLYYRFGNEKNGTYVITGSSGENLDEAIDEAISDIRKEQKEHPISAYLSSSSTVDTFLGTLNMNLISVRPKGTLKVKYDVYTIQNRDAYDYYIVKANCTGNPGKVLYKENKNYSKLYKGKKMVVRINTPSTDALTDSFGPESSNNAKSYTVNLGGGLQGLKKSQLSLGLQGSVSYSRSINNTQISANVTNKTAEWTLKLSSDATKQTCFFEPTVTFNCPKEKKSVDLVLETTYTVGGLLSNEKLSSKQKIRLYPNRYEYV